MGSTDTSAPATEHPALARAAFTAVEAIEQMPAILGRSSWMPDWEFAQRARHLAGHLRQVLQASAVPAYPSALALCRATLEHHLLDELLLHGTVYRQTYTGVDDDLFAEYEADLAAGTEPWTQGVRSLERHGRSRAVIVREGFDVQDDEGAVVQKLSPYWLFTRRHQPLVGRAGDQADDGLGDVEELKINARRNEDLYRSYLSWSALRDNLVLNDLYTEAEVRRVDVHYRFLSMYVHGTSAGYDPFRDGGISGHDHYFGELVLLYVAWVAASELDTFARYLARRHLGGGDELRDLSADLTIATAYFWPPKGAPQAYDRWTEANRRRIIQLRANRQDEPAVAPAELMEDDVNYYVDPLRRLRGLHATTQEFTTGFTYVSPWPRADARLR